MPDVWEAVTPTSRTSGDGALVAAEFVDWLDLPGDRQRGRRGVRHRALSSVIAARCEPAEVLGVDPSEAYVAWAAAHVEDRRVRLTVADATQLPAGPFDAVVSGLVLNFIPDAATATAAMRLRCIDPLTTGKLDSPPGSSPPSWTPSGGSLPLLATGREGVQGMIDAGPPRGYG